MPSSARDSGWRYWIFGDLQVSWRKRIGYTQWPSTLASKKHVGLVIMHKLWHHLVICSRKKWKMGEHPPTKTRRWMKTRNSLLCVPLLLCWYIVESPSIAAEVAMSGVQSEVKSAGSDGSSTWIPAGHQVERRKSWHYEPQDICTLNAGTPDFATPWQLMTYLNLSMRLDAS